MTIKHLVLSGGGPTLFQTMGILDELHNKKYWHLKNIESIYGTSAGAIVATTISLGFDWPTINEYFIARPWQYIFPVSASSIFDAYTKKGLFNKEAITKGFAPLFNAKDIPLSISMKEYYERTKIDLYCYTIELNDFRMVEMSHHTHPDLEVLEAVYRSCAIPIFFSPVCTDTECYLDGGLIDNYPIHYCTDRVSDKNEILGVYVRPIKDSAGEDNDKKVVTSESTIIDYIDAIINKMIRHMNNNNNNNNTHVPNEIKCAGQKITLSYLQDVIASREIRQTLFNSGRDEAAAYLSSPDSEPQSKLPIATEL